MNVLVHQKSFRGGAHLTRVVVTTVDRSLHRGVEIRIGEDDERAITAKLEQVRLESCRLGDTLAGLG